MQLKCNTLKRVRQRPYQSDLTQLDAISARVKHLPLVKLILFVISLISLVRSCLSLTVPAKESWFGLREILPPKSTATDCFDSK